MLNKELNFETVGSNFNQFLYGHGVFIVVCLANQIDLETMHSQTKEQNLGNS